MNFKLRQLRGFRAAALHGSFSIAARELAMTQPAFSQLIRELEGTLGVRLFERTTRRVTLTEAGRRFQQMVERPLDDLEHAYRHLRDVAAGREGRIVFASLPSVAFGFVALVLARFKAKHPAITVRLIEDQNLNIIERVLNKEVDFGISTLSGLRPELKYRELIRDEMYAVLPKEHPLSRRKSFTWRDLAAEPLAGLPRQSSIREMLDTGLAANGAIREPTYEVVNMVTAASIVRAGLGVTLLPNIALKELGTNGLSVRRLTKPRPMRSIGIVCRADRDLAPAAAAFVEMLFTDPRRGDYSVGESRGAASARARIHASRL